MSTRKVEFVIREVLETKLVVEFDVENIDLDDLKSEEDPTGLKTLVWDEWEQFDHLLGDRDHLSNRSFLEPIESQVISAQLAPDSVPVTRTRNEGMATVHALVPRGERQSWRMVARHVPPSTAELLTQHLPYETRVWA
ncbi:hypothetical protein [Lentzea flava]|uniref:Uncharacterized protein n=1 Tax=Lentzea flava TaxID=103732 RepID=A0ABQ2UPE6_9PSEU|nr:hypothetical protein [Lentzea flava]MCP2200041.1 hypothetical protein [Lentzea flava]GGU45746.1 hypothetical protein GCM10010178_42750 [Lentzea flava]